VKEFWIIVGRRGGKDSIASLIISYIAALFNKRQRLRSGEIALCVALACDREQSKIVLGYTRSYFADRRRAWRLSRRMRC
jgi:phage terminase large subunit-like protein